MQILGATIRPFDLKNKTDRAVEAEIRFEDSMQLAYELGKIDGQEAITSMIRAKVQEIGKTTPPPTPTPAPPAPPYPSAPLVVQLVARGVPATVAVAIAMQAIAAERRAADGTRNRHTNRMGDLYHND